MATALRELQDLRLRLKLITTGLFVLLSVAAVSATAAPLEESNDSGAEVLDRYMSQMQSQQSSLRGMQMDTDIDAIVPKLKKSGKMHALRNISALGRITYNGFKFIGDNAVKSYVIVKYLTAEQQAQDQTHLALTPENYKFKFKGLTDRNGKQVYVFQVNPRKKMVGLFKGELWLDPSTCLPIRDSGRFVKSPSVWIKKWEFVRDYDIKNGVAIPSHIDSTVDTRIWGPVEVSINYSNFTKAEGEAAEAISGRDSQ